MSDNKNGGVASGSRKPARPNQDGRYIPPNMQIGLIMAKLTSDEPVADPELRRKLAVVVKHLHAIIDELEIGEPELQVAYAFLDRIGANNDAMLLGDHLGLSVRANDISYYRAKGTAPNVIGPLYREDAPFMDNPGRMVDDDEPGRHILLQGQVRDCDTGEPLAGAVLDFWQASDKGFYEEQDPNLPDYEFRRRIRADENGRYAFHTIVPGGYYIANRDTPVVELTQAVGLGSFRAPHIHLMVDMPGYGHLTTLIYFEGDPANDDDCIFSCRPENMARITPATEPGGLENCVFDIELIHE